MQQINLVAARQDWQPELLPNVIQETFALAQVRLDHANVGMVPFRSTSLTVPRKNKVFIFPVNLHQSANQVERRALHTGSFGHKKSAVNSNAHLPYL